jgi:hypothetical protein
MDVAGCLPELVDVIRPVREQAAAGDKPTPAIGRGQLVPRGQPDDQIAMTSCRSARAKVVMARSISVASRTSTGLNSIPIDGAAAWTAANCPIPEAMAGCLASAAAALQAVISGRMAHALTRTGA